MTTERILIVEDHVTLEGKPLAKRVREAGYEVVGIAETEEAAVRMAARECPSVVLMDIGLRDDQGKDDRLAGLRAARRIRAETGAQVIFITGILTEADVLAEARKTSDYQFWVKPVPDEQLHASILLAVGRRRRKNLIFIAYSHGDSRFAKEMMEHLNALRGMETRSWIDMEIVPGQRWKDEINRALSEASSAICLVSSKFVDSHFINDSRTTDAAKGGGAWWVARVSGLCQLRRQCHSAPPRFARISRGESTG